MAEGTITAVCARDAAETLTEPQPDEKPYEESEVRGWIESEVTLGDVIEEPVERVEGDWKSQPPEHPMVPTATNFIDELSRGHSCGLTFELSGRQRQDARPGLAKMYRVPPARAWWPAVGAPLERGVRRHS
jgi:hypothetical protein